MSDTAIIIKKDSSRVVTTTDSEALRISKKLLSILAADLQSRDTRSYAQSILERVGLGTQEK